LKQISELVFHEQYGYRYVFHPTIILKIMSIFLLLKEVEAANKMLLCREAELSAQNARLIQAQIVLEVKLAALENDLAGKKSLEANVKVMEAALADKAAVEARLVALETELASKTAELAQLEPLEAALADTRAQVARLEARLHDLNALTASDKPAELAHRKRTRPASVDAAEAMVVLQGGGACFGRGAADRHDAALNGGGGGVVEPGQLPNYSLVSSEESVSGALESVTGPNFIGESKVAERLASTNLAGPSYVSLPNGEAGRIPDPRSLAERYAALAAKERQLSEKERMISELLAQFGSAGASKNVLNQGEVEVEVIEKSFNRRTGILFHCHQNGKKIQQL
jgi:uncharacterized coiled-coil protein SlyX